MKIPPFLGLFVFPPTLPMTHLASCLTLTGRPCSWQLAYDFDPKLGLFLT